MKIILLIVFICFVAFMSFGAYVSHTQPSDPSQGEREKMCAEWMSDAALGSERRMTREICKQLGVKP